MSKDNTTVNFGWTSIIGYLTMLGASLPVIIKTIEEGQVAFGGPEKWLALLGIVVGAVTTLIRGLQAAAKVHRAP